MNKVLKLIVLTQLMVAAIPAFSQQPSPYKVTNWPGNRSCAISYTFDDGCSNQFTKAIPIFDEFGYKLTLFTVSSWVGNWSYLKSAAENGHEVANHSMVHPRFDTMSVDEQKTELKTSNDLINSNVPSQKSITMATPYCVKGNDSLAKTFFIAVRGCQGVIEPKTPSSFMNVSSIICGSEGSVKKTSDFKSRANSAASSKGWLVYLIHGIDNDGGWSSLSSDTLRQSLVYLKENDNKFWVTTFVNAARYIKERNCATFTETASTDTSFTVTISDTLSNNTIFNLPLTILRELPAGWSDAKVTQNDLPIADTIVEINSVKYIQFDVVPDGASVVITKVFTVGNKDKTGYHNNDLKIRVQNNAITVQAPATCTQYPTVSVYNIMGQLLLKSENVKTTNGQFTISPLPFKFPGIYFVRLTDNNSTWSKKIQWQ